ncbi:MAG: hypothetical protein EXR75_08440 [Myxococcales bacterium]|nr:hypothetical protein [Myxococcales bacterium]
MAPEAPCCAVCASEESVVGVVVGGRQLFLCKSHAEKLGNTTPARFEKLAQLDATAGLTRRTQGDRRASERRMFPPRPELRRHDDGRRDGDPQS